jgi:hypothetical protein
MKNVLLIVQEASGVDVFLSLAEKDASQNGRGIFILALGEQVKDILRKNRKKFIEINDFLSYEENLAIDRSSRDIAEKWFNDPKFSGRLEYRNINLGCVIMNGFDEYLTWLFKQYAVVKKILSEKNIAEVIVFGGKNDFILRGEFNDIQDSIVSGIARRLCLERNISYKAVCTDKDFDDGPTASPRSSIKDIIKGSAKKIIGGLLSVFCAVNKDTAKKKILVSSSYMHVKEVMKAVIKSKKYSIHYLREIFSIKQSILFGLRGVRYEIFPDKKISSNITKKMESLWHSLEGVLGKEEAFLFDGVSFDPFIRSRMEIICRQTFAKIAASIDYFYELLEKNKFSLIIVEEDVCVFNKSLILVANQVGVKSIVFQHGFVGAVKEFRRGFYPLYATKTTAWGDITKETLLTYGIPEESIAVIGCPRLSRLDSVLKQDQAQIKRRLGLDISDKVIFYPDQGLLEEHIHIASGTSNEKILARYVLDIIKTVLELTGVQLIIKNHPGLYGRMVKMIEDSPELNLLVSEAKKQKKVIFADNIDLLKILAISDLVIFDTTTVGFLALPFNKPVVHYTLMPTIKEQFYYKYGAFYTAMTQHGLKGVVRHALDFPDERKENRQRYVEEYFYDSPGAVFRAVRLIDKMVA